MYVSWECMQKKVKEKRGEIFLTKLNKCFHITQSTLLTISMRYTLIRRKIKEKWSPDFNQICVFIRMQGAYCEKYSMQLNFFLFIYDKQMHTCCHYNIAKRHAGDTWLSFSITHSALYVKVFFLSNGFICKCGVFSPSIVEIFLNLTKHMILNGEQLEKSTYMLLNIY